MGVDVLAPYAIAIALFLDFILGDPAWPWHPVRLFGHLISGLEPVCRSLPLSAREQGAVFLLLNLFFCLLPVLLIVRLVSSFAALAPVVYGVLIYFALGGTCLAREVSALSEALDLSGVSGGRASLRMLVSRDVDDMSEEDIASSGIETLSENFCDSACATLLYAALGGPLLVWVHRAANTLDAMVGYRTPAYEEFGWASAKFDDIMNYLPARVSALLIALSSGAAGGSPRETIARAVSDGGVLESPNSGYPIAAFAGALRLRLCGPTRYFGRVKEKPYIGGGARPVAADLARAIHLYWNAYALAAACSVLLGGILYR